MSDGAKKFEERQEVLQCVKDLTPMEKFMGETYSDPVSHPSHYNSHPSGVECIDITKHMNFNLGNALKYIWRADLKNDAVEDLKKAIWYIEKELEMRNE